MRNFFMSHEKRTLIALIVSFIFCIIWVQMLQDKQKKWVEQQEAQKKIEKDKQQQNAPQQNPNVDNTPETPEIPKPILPQNSSNLGTADEEKSITVDTDKYRILWSNRGAVLVSAKFKTFFHNYANREEENWHQNPKNWLEVIPDFTPEYKTFGLSNEEEITLDGKQVKVRLNDLLWKSEGVKVKEDKTQELAFSVGPINGITYKKIFVFSPESYTWQGQIVLENQGEKCRRTLSLVVGAGIDLDSLDDVNEAHRSLYGYTMYTDDIGRISYKSYDHSSLVAGKAKLEKNITWYGLGNRYFSYILHLQPSPANHLPYQIANSDSKSFVPEQSWIDSAIAVRRERKETVLSDSVKKIQIPLISLRTKAFDLNTAQTLTIPFTYQIYTKNRMVTIDPTYKEVDDFGMFGFISRFLLWIMAAFYRIFHNYGIAIICLTLVIKLAMFPLTRKQQMSMAKYQKQMKIFQPELRKIQEKYKDDKAKLNEEMLKLYKQHGVSPFPAGGCLPMFIQLPIFIGLYQALYYAIDLRQASFLWITDLSLPDRFFHFGSYIPWFGDYFNLLPIIMTIVWVVQQKTAPKPEEPQMQQQQKIFLYMTVFFGFMFYHIASGLVLYWMVMNVFGIVEQIIIKKQMPADLVAK